MFSNFRASDLSLESTAPFGVRALKIFLEYAEHRNLHSMEATSDDTDSPFEDAVYEFLRNSLIGIGRSLTAPPSHTTWHTGPYQGGSVWLHVVVST